MNCIKAWTLLLLQQILLVIPSSLANDLSRVGRLGSGANSDAGVSVDPSGMDMTPRQPGIFDEKDPDVADIIGGYEVSET